MTNPPSPKELLGEYDVYFDVRHKEQDTLLAYPFPEEARDENCSKRRK
jgi:hypothetical protein